MIKFRTIKVRLYPTDLQKEILNLTFDLCSKMYNELLFRQGIIYEDYLKEKDNISDVSLYFKSHKRDTVKTIKQGNEDYYKVDSLALEFEEKNLFNAFNMFFKKHNGYPRFKTPKDDHSYYTRCVNDNIYFTKEFLRLPRVGRVDIRGMNEKYLGYDITTVKVYEYKNTKYYAHIVVKYEEDEEVIDNNVSNVVGLDFKVSDLFVTNEGYTPYYPSAYYKYIDHLRCLEKALKYKSFNTKSRKKHITKIINIHKKIKNFRDDLLHKISNYLCKIYSYVIIETLDLKEIAQDLHNGTNTYDTSYGNFIKMLNYKVKGSVVKVYKWFPSSKLCSNCGYKKKNLTLSDRIYSCDRCRYTIDRDINAAINIRNKGIKMIQNMEKAPLI